MGDRRLPVLFLLVAGGLAACSGTSSGGGGGGGSGGGGSTQAPAAASNGYGGGGGGGGGGGPTGTSVAAGGDLCGLLGQGDWAAVGVTDATKASENNNPPDGYYCVYRGKSSATGGLELDVFLSPTVDDAKGTFTDVFTELIQSSNKPVTIPGADEAALSLPSSAGSTDPAVIGARKGKLTFDLGMGSSFATAEQNGEQLKQLAALILARAAALGN
jgi:hypothetical protein